MAKNAARLFAALVVCLLATHPDRLSAQTSSLEFRGVAKAVKQFLDRDEQTTIAITQFKGPANNLLAAELKRHGIEVQTPAKFILQGSFSAADSQGLAARLAWSIRDRSGEVHVAAEGNVHRQIYTNTIDMTLALIPAGTFTMGSPTTENGHSADEREREISIPQAFHMSAHEVTVGQFRKFIQETGHKTSAETSDGGYGYNSATRQFEGPARNYTWENPGWRQSERHAVVNVSWTDAVEFCKWLSRKEKAVYELPTEAEWEYACRAGAKFRFSAGADVKNLASAANVAEQSLRTAIDFEVYKESFIFMPWSDGQAFAGPVGQFDANAFGLHDMHGNVAEWCVDSSGDSRSLRGGSWCNNAIDCRAAKRDSENRSMATMTVGFRVVRRLSQKVS